MRFEYPTLRKERAGWAPVDLVEGIEQKSVAATGRCLEGGENSGGKTLRAARATHVPSQRLLFDVNLLQG
jgi:hypothetical protein